MTIPIIEAVIRHDGRVPGKPGVVIGRYVYEDGTDEPFLRFAPADEDVAAAMQAEIPTREAGRRNAEIRHNAQLALTHGSHAEVSLRASSREDAVKAVSDMLPDLIREQAIMAKDFLNAQTDDALAAALKVDAGVAGTLRVEKYAPAAALADSIRADKGA